MTAYTTFAEKASRFQSEQIQTFSQLHSRLCSLKKEGYYFRGQREAFWKLECSAQREWRIRNLSARFASIHEFIQSHINYQRSYAASQLAEQCSQLNDISVLSTMQHFGGPTPFLDFTTDTDAVLFFATDNLSSGGAFETSDWFSIYAWKPGEGAGTGSSNDLFNWEKVIDQYGGLIAASEYGTLKGIATLYIKQDSGKFLELTNPRLKRQGGLFLYSSAALSSGKPYEELFDGRTAADVGDFYDGLFIPKMICLNIRKSIVPDVTAHLRSKGVSKSSLGLGTADWSSSVFNDFLKTLKS